MSKDAYLVISDGTFSLQETDTENQFLFYRNDEKVLGDDVEDEVMTLVNAYMVDKFMQGEFSNVVSCNVQLEISTDDKRIRVTLNNIEQMDLDEDDDGEDAEENEACDTPDSLEPTNFFQRIFNKLFGK